MTSPSNNDSVHNDISTAIQYSVLNAVRIRLITSVKSNFSHSLRAQPDHASMDRLIKLSSGVQIQSSSIVATL